MEISSIAADKRRGDIPPHPLSPRQNAWKPSKITLREF
jgi:hypothetical protein